MKKVWARVLFWGGIAVVVAAHAYMLFGGFTAMMVKPHAWMNIGAVLMIVSGHLMEVMD